MSLNKQLVRQHFDRHAAEYDAHTPLQAEMGEHLLALCAHLTPSRILELGCGTGRLTARIRQHWPDAELHAIDLAASMLPIARKRVPDAQFRVADAETFEPDGHFDLVISNATVQWFATPAETLSRLPCSHLAFSTFAANTFCELRICFAAAGESDRILPMPTTEHWRTLAAGIGEIQTCDVRNAQIVYPSVQEFVNTVRRSGASNAYATKPLRPSRWREVIQEYEKRYSCTDGVVATYEQLFLLITT
jgi:malonyl-CoA O-methyltransferase